MLISSNRRADIAIIRIVSMLMIVLCHIIRFYTFIPGSQVLNQFFNVGVEIFLGISGFLYGKKTVTDFKYWIRKRAQRIWVPVIIIVMINIVMLELIYHVHTDIITSIVYLLNLQGLLFINWKIFGSYIKEITTLGPLWFTTVIMICYLLLPIFQKIRIKLRNDPNKNRKYVLLIILSLIIDFILEYFTTTTLFYITTFLIGYILSDLQFDQMKFSIRKSVMFMFSILLMGAVRIVLRIFIDGTTLYSTIISVTQLIMGISMMCLGMELCKKYKVFFDKLSNLKVIQFLDRESFYIYLVHGMFFTGVTSVYANFNLWLATIIFIIVVILVAMLLEWLTNFTNGKIDSII